MLGKKRGFVKKNVAGTQATFSIQILLISYDTETAKKFHVKLGTLLTSSCSSHFWHSLRVLPDKASIYLSSHNLVFIYLVFFFYHFFWYQNGLVPIENIKLFLVTFDMAALITIQPLNSFS